MEFVNRIVADISNLKATDWIALIASLSALVVSLFSYRQRFNEGRLALRKQLTDLFEKLTFLNAEGAKARLKQDDYPPNYPGLLNDQRRFLARQVSFLIAKIGDLVSPYEYLVLAGAYDDLNDPYQAELYFQLAKASAIDPIDKGISIRRYARYLFNGGEDRLGDARSHYQQALDIFPPTGDRNIEYRADTYKRWSELEHEWGHLDEALRHQELAIAEYQRLSNPTRRQYELAHFVKIEIVQSDEG